MAAAPADPDVLELARAFRADPLGRHGPALREQASRMRSGPVAGKFCLICVKPHAEWMIGRISGQRGVAPVIEGNQVFTSLADAEWAVFKLRWAQTHGVALDEDAL